MQGTECMDCVSERTEYLGEAEVEGRKKDWTKRITDVLRGIVSLPVLGFS